MQETVTLATNIFTIVGIVIAFYAAFLSWRSANAAKRQAEAAEAALQETRVQSALARKALIEAKTQNEIAVHTHRLDAYKALLVFRTEVLTKSTNFSRESLYNLWEHVKLAKFYFTPSVTKHLNDITDIAVKIQAAEARLAQPDGYKSQTIKNLRENLHAYDNQLIKAIEEVDDEMCNALTLVQRDT